MAAVSNSRWLFSFAAANARATIADFSLAAAAAACSPVVDPVVITIADFSFAAANARATTEDPVVVLEVARGLVQDVVWLL